MAISFADSLRAATNQLQNSPATPFIVSDPDSSTINVYSSDNWTLSDRYVYYEDYSDEALSSVDSMKNITLDNTQINLTQESNSQYIPFIMPRYYDGFDLMQTRLQFYYVNKNNNYGLSAPINVYYSDTQIKLAWLVDRNVTAIEGSVSFEIQAVGTNSKGKEYVWKTKTSNDLKIIKSLAGSGAIIVDDDWTISYMEKASAAKEAADKAHLRIDELDIRVTKTEADIVTVLERLDTIERNINELQEDVQNDAEVYVGPDEPVDAPDGTIWIDTDDNSEQPDLADAVSASGILF